MIKILGKGLPIAGRIKLGLSGGKTPDGKQRPPVRVDHFEITGTERDVNDVLLPDGALLERLLAFPEIKTCGGCKRSQELAEKLEKPVLAGGLPTAIPILLPYDDLELNFQHTLAWFRGSAMFCRGDGETAERRQVTRNEKGEEIFGAFAPHAPCAVGGCPDIQEDAKGVRHCKPSARLRVMLGVQQIVGQVYEFRTSSWNSIRNLQEALKQIQLVSGGVLQYVPMYLECGPQTITRPGGRTTTQMIAKIAFHGSPQELLSTVHGMLELRAPMLERVRELEASISREWTLSPDDVRELRDEFDPEGVAAETSHPPDAEVPAVPSLEEEELPPEIAGYGCRHAGNPIQSGSDWLCELCGQVIDPAGPDPGAPDPNAKISPEQQTAFWHQVQARTRELYRSPTKPNAADVLRAVLATHEITQTAEMTVIELPDVLETAKSITRKEVERLKQSGAA